jgi:cellulose synthase/poly-beta-1,6-N-acetylglucosamine synthase-like glycosyltransferase
MTTIAYILLFLYCVTLLYITIYCLAQFQLLYYYKKNKLEETKSVMPGKEEEFPFVTIQLPIFNELYVVERLIDNIVQIEYPSDRLEIQVLDDSTDETMELCRKKVEEQRAKGVNIEWIHRVDREGFKAGALRDGMARARGEFIAIFDADFLPRPDFLLRTIPYFEDEDVGVVQTRWEHINRDYSMLTRLQAMQLNVHFTVEQQGRAAGNVFLQFNGTAGVWRRETIEDAGGWEADTLTEDLDLSYRAQLKGWRIVYLEKVGSPAELPAEMNGLKSQQFRWMKGGAENARRLLPKVWKSELPLRQKLHSTFHLMASSVFLFVFMAGFLSVPMVFALQEIQFDSTFFTFSLAGLVSIIVIYYVGNVEAELHKEGSNLKNIFKFLILFPLFLALSMGLSLHNSIAVLQGYIGKKSAFIRTPKFNIQSLKDSFQKTQYLSRKIPFTTILEGLLTLYFLGGVIASLYSGIHAFLIFHILLVIGFGTIAYYSVKHRG